MKNKIPLSISSSCISYCNCQLFKFFINNSFLNCYAISSSSISREDFRLVSPVEAKETSFPTISTFTIGKNFVNIFFKKLFNRFLILNKILTFGYCYYFFIHLFVVLNLFWDWLNFRSIK